MSDENPWINYGLDVSNLGDELERIITTPHEHEFGTERPPLWLLWEVNDIIPYLLAVATNERDARYMIADHVQERKTPNFFVERVPGNHPFGSSLRNKMAELTQAEFVRWHERSRQIRSYEPGKGYSREGD